MVVLKRPRLANQDGLKAIVRDPAIAQSSDWYDRPTHNEQWELLLDYLEELLALAAWIVLLLAAGILIFH